MDTVIQVKKVYKDYKIYHKDSDILKDFIFKSRDHKIFRALNDVNFEVKKGKSYGILGRNGSGKSTILKIINQTAFPTKGEVKVKGKVALLDVGGGIINGYTGRENIYHKCQLMGLSNKKIKKIEQSIVDFSELGEFIDQPVKKYSSGMRSKLGFAIAIHNELDILIVDEALSVGDSRFQKKCENKMNELKNKGCTILLVSHASGKIASFCDEAIFIDRGEMVMEGRAKKVAKLYEEYMKKAISEEKINELKIKMHLKYEIAPKISTTRRRRRIK